MLLNPVLPLGKLKNRHNILKMLNWLSCRGWLAQLEEHSPTNPAIRGRFTPKPKKLRIEERFLAPVAIKLHNNPVVKILTQKNNFDVKMTKSRLNTIWIKQNGM